MRDSNSPPQLCHSCALPDELTPQILCLDKLDVSILAQIWYNGNMETALTGLRTNSEMTLGNYLGALLPMVRMANEKSKECRMNIFVPDLHSIISDIDGNLSQNVITSLKYYLASGLNMNENIHFYRQSRVPAHSELCWILDCVATMGETSRMIQYKEKSGEQESCNVGIFNYPILMAADILLYSAKYVLVGEDQFQHIELTRDIAERFNRRFEKDIFVVPVSTKEQLEFMNLDQGLRIRNLVDPTKKMSKSNKSANSKILLTDKPEVAKKKIMVATTDSLARIRFNMKEQPGISNLLQIEALVKETPLTKVIDEWKDGNRYGDLKKRVAETVAGMLADFQAKIDEVTDAEVLALLEDGEKYANRIANQKLREAQEAFGLR